MLAIVNCLIRLVILGFLLKFFAQMDYFVMLCFVKFLILFAKAEFLLRYLILKSFLFLHLMVHIVVIK